MKTFYAAHILILTGIFLSACQEKTSLSEPSEEVIRVSADTVFLASSGSAIQIVTIESDAAWKSSVGASWLFLSMTEGSSGSTDIELSALDNTSDKERCAEVLFYSNYSSRALIVKQYGKPRQFSCTLSEQSIHYTDAYDYEPYSLDITTGADPVDIDFSECNWLESLGSTKIIAEESTKTLKFAPCEPNYSTMERNGILRFKGRTSGETVEIPVSQAGSFQNSEESLENRWRITSTLTSSTSWRDRRRMISNHGDSSAILSIESSPNSDITIMADGGKATFKGMRTGDHILLRAPVKEIAAGTDVTVALHLGQKTNYETREWVAEYWDEEQWHLMRTFHTCNQSDDYNITTCICDFTLSRAIVNDYVKVRFRLVSGATADQNFICPSPRLGAALIINKDYPAIIDSNKILILGNSFTYYWSSDFTLKQLARAQGHRLDIFSHTEPGVSLLQHARSFTLSKDVIKEGGFDYAILQEVSTTYARYADGSNSSGIAEAQIIKGEILAYSPNCRLILEQTWAYEADDYKGYGSFESFDKWLKKGTADVASQIDATVSPIGDAFAEARSSAPEIGLYASDLHHPSNYGSYLKVCVNYQAIFSEDFTAFPYLQNMKEEKLSVLRNIARTTYNNH